MENFQTKFRDRLAWLGRMPRPYKFLFGSQTVVMLFLIHRRIRLVEAHNKKIEALEQEEQTNSPWGSQDQDKRLVLSGASSADTSAPTIHTGSKESDQTLQMDQGTRHKKNPNSSAAGQQTQQQQKKMTPVEIYHEMMKKKS